MLGTFHCIFVITTNAYDVELSMNAIIKRKHLKNILPGCDLAFTFSCSDWKLSYRYSVDINFFIPASTEISKHDTMTISVLK